MACFKRVFGLVLLLLLVSASGISYAWFLRQEKETQAYSFTTGCLRVTIENAKNAINIGNAGPVDDVVGLQTTPYTFTIRNTCTTTEKYHVNLEVLNATTLDTNVIKTALFGDTFDNIVKPLSALKTETASLSNSLRAYTLYEGELGGNQTKSFGLRLWIDKSAKTDCQNKVFKSKIDILINPEYQVTKHNEIKTELKNRVVEGVITGSSAAVKYCYAKDSVCVPNRNAQVSGNKVSIGWEPKNYPQSICSQVGSDSTVYCGEVVVDVEPPTDPTISLRNGMLYFEGSTDNLEIVEYYYSVGCNANLDTYTKGTSVKVSSTNSVCVNFNFLTTKNLKIKLT